MPAKQADNQSLPAPVRHAIAKASIEANATQKQLDFAMHLASGTSQTEALRRAYDISDGRSAVSLAVDAHRIAQNPKVNLMLEAARISQTNLSASKGQQWRERIDEKLSELVEKKDIADRDLVAALKLAGSQVHVQAFSKAVDAGDAAAANLQNAISDFFSAVSESGITIDAEFSPVLESQETWQVVDSIESAPLEDTYDELDTRSPCIAKAGQI